MWRNVERVKAPIAVARGPVGGPLTSAFVSLVVVDVGSGDRVSSSFSTDSKYR